MPNPLNELIDAVEHAVADLRQTDPLRLAEPRWQRVLVALAAAQTAGTIDPGQQGEAPVSRAHPETSRKAARIAMVGSQEHALLYIVDRRGISGSTAYEAAENNLWNRIRPGMPVNQIGARMLGLRQKGLVGKLRLPDGEVLTRKTHSAKAEVHVITPAGRKELDRLGAP